jgi:hypothetical protein
MESNFLTRIGYVANSFFFSKVKKNKDFFIKNQTKRNHCQICATISINEINQAAGIWYETKIWIYAQKLRALEIVKTKAS